MNAKQARETTEKHAGRYPAELYQLCTDEIKKVSRLGYDEARIEVPYWTAHAINFILARLQDDGFDTEYLRDGSRFEIRIRW